jgi:hypothetical protein
MASTTKGAGTAPDATAATSSEHPAMAEFYQQQREAYVAQLEAEIEAVTAKRDGMNATLAAKRDELKQARAAARKG